jgi:hypothetical protein
VGDRTGDDLHRIEIGLEIVKASTATGRPTGDDLHEIEIVKASTATGHRCSNGSALTAGQGGTSGA